jgi:hypothetical protein
MSAPKTQKNAFHNELRRAENVDRARVGTGRRLLSVFYPGWDQRSVRKHPKRIKKTSRFERRPVR